MGALKTARVGCRLALLGLLGLAATRCADPVSWPHAVVDNFGNPSFGNSGYYQPARLVIRSDPEWQEAWAKLQQHVGPQPPVPTIDFSKEMVVLVAMGQQPNASTHTLVTAAAVNGDTLEISVDEVLSNRCLSLASYSQPAAVVRGPRFEGKVTFTTNRYERTCP